MATCLSPLSSIDGQPYPLRLVFPDQPCPLCFVYGHFAVGAVEAEAVALAIIDEV